MNWTDASGLGINVPFNTENIQKITLPKSIISINGDSFKNLSKLKTINIEENIAHIDNIGADAFYGCTSLENITINNNIRNDFWKKFKKDS